MQHVGSRCAAVDAAIARIFYSRGLSRRAGIDHAGLAPETQKWPGSARDREGIAGLNQWRPWAAENLWSNRLP